MNKHVNDWLDAYYDGELRGTRLRQVEQHLDTCPSCRAELEALRTLSAMLQIPDPDVEFLPADRFAANLALHLPRRAQQLQPQAAITSRLWLVPVGLLAIWVCLQITYSLGTVFSLAANSDLFGSQLAWLQGEALRMNWFTTGMRLFGDQVSAPGRAVLATLNDTHVIIAQWAQRLFPQAVLAVGYLAWLFIWWLRHQNSPEHLPGSFPGSETQNGH